MTFKDIDRKAKRVRATLDGLGKWLKVVGVILAATVGVWGAGYGASAFLDSRYTLTKDLTEHKQTDTQQFAETRLLFLENRQGQLEEQQFKLKIEKERRPLTGLERERLDKVEKELDKLNQQIEREQKKANPTK